MINKFFPALLIGVDKHKKKLYWDPVKEIFKDNIEANKLLSRPQRLPYGTNYVAKKRT